MVSLGEIVEVSPTYLSTDLLTPNEVQRVTLPYLRYKLTRSNRDRLPSIWGTEATKYGGVGKLRYLSQQGKGNQVIVSRSHRHYDSGVIGVNVKQDTTQPYSVTSLKLSNCRRNDQLMLPPLMSNLIEEEKLDEPWPKHLRDPFTSQICMYDVFPRFDPIRSEFDVTLSRRVNQKLGPATLEALNRLNREIYQTSMYQSTYNNKDLDKTGQEHLKNNLGNQCYMDTKLTMEKDKEEAQEEDEQKDETEEDWKNTTDKKQKRKTNSKDKEENEIFSDSESHKSNKDNDTEKQICEHCKKATWPVWPPGMDNITNDPPGYPKVWIPRYTPKRYTVIEGWQRPCQHHDQQGLGSTQAEIKKLPLETDDNRTLRLPAILVKNGENVRAESFKLPNTTEYSHCIRRKAVNIPEIGTPFKSEAHQRYHLSHPEPTPDLRESTKTAKRHFFSGVHASILR